MSRKKPRPSQRRKKLSSVISEFDQKYSTELHQNRMICHPDFVDIINGFFISTRRGSYNMESCASLYNRILHLNTILSWKNSFRVAAHTIHYTEKKIMKDLNWGNKKVEKAIKTLKEFGLIDHGRLETKKNLLEETRLYVVPFSKIDLNNIAKLMTEINPESQFTVQFTGTVKNNGVYINTVKNNGVSSYTTYNSSNTLGDDKTSPQADQNNSRIRKTPYTYLEIKNDKRLKITSVKQIPKWMLHEIEELRKHLSSIRPDNKNYLKENWNKPHKLIAQANGLLKVAREEPVKLIRKVLKFQRSDMQWWGQPRGMNTYAGVYNSTANGIKFETIRVKMEDQEQPYKSKQETFNTTEHYHDEWEEKQFLNLADKVGANNGSLKQFHDGIQSLKQYWDSIPDVGFKKDCGNHVFFGDFWEFAGDYINFLEENTNGGFSLVLLKPSHPKGSYFKQFIYKHIPDTRASYYRMNVTNDGRFTFA